MTTLAHVCCSKTGTIETFQVSDEGLLPVASSRVAQGAAVLAIDASGTHGYLAGKDPVGIVVVDLDPATGQWTPSTVVETEAPLASLALSGDGRFLLGASYHGSFALVWELEDGVPGVPRARVDQDRAHCVVERDGFVYVVSLGGDVVAGYELLEDGSLDPVGELVFEPGTGPRHLVLDAEGTHGYLVSEFTAEAFVLERDRATGIMADVADVSIADPSAGLGLSRPDADPAAERLVWGADVALIGGERFLLASERTASTLAVVDLSVDDAEPFFVATETQPRGFGVAPDDRHVLVVGEKSESATLYVLRDQAMERVGSAPVGLGAQWVRFTQH